MPSIPLKVQLGIRDKWTNQDSPVQKALKELKDVLGHDVVVDPEWQLLLAELDSFYEDKTYFVASVAGTVQVWAKGLVELLEDDANEEWTEKLLDRTTNAGSQLRLYIEVATSEKDNVTTSWSSERAGFIITLPKRQVHQPTEFMPIIRGDFLSAFSTEQKTSIALRDAPAAMTASADDWADVEMDKSTGKAQVVEAQKPLSRPIATTSQEVLRPKVEYLPSAASLPRPDELLLKGPYHLVLYAREREIEVQCSHSPSLQLLGDYLKRWCRANHHDTRAPPGVAVKLWQSAFGLGEMFDRLVLSTEETRYTVQFKVTAPILLSLIEGVLGYDAVSAEPGVWSFRRDAEFKRL